MARQSPQIPIDQSTSSRWWVALALSLALTALVGWLDYSVGPGVSVLPFYLIAIALAAWTLGSGMAVFICTCATLVSLLVRLQTRATPVADLWNAGMRFGVYLAFAMVVGHLRTQNRDFPIFGLVRRAIGISLVAAIVLLGIGIAIRRSSPNHADESSHVAFGSGVTRESAEASSPLANLAMHLPMVLRDSRAVLLGSRDPNGPSCVAVVLTGEVKDSLPANPGDLDGGPGTKKSVLLFFDREKVKSPLQDYLWQQSRMKKFLENEAAENQDARTAVHELFLKAEQLAQKFDSSVTWPADIVPANFDSHDDWPSYCLWRIDRAAQAKNLPETKRWSHELAGALFGLDDLHSWLDFLCNNELEGLAFAAQCHSLFIAGGEPSPEYNPNLNISLYPSGVLVLNGLSNYYEVERQAECLYSWPADQTGTMPFDQNLTPATLWLPPNLRECFLKLQRVLSPQNQQQWEQAAHTPYEHGYLVNMLYHAWRSDSAEHLSKVLSRFNAVSPDASVTQLLGTLTYRGHAFGGLEWMDRYSPGLMEAAEHIQGSDIDALMAACRWTNQFYLAPAKYGTTFTLRDAIENKKLDCVRATDMISAIFRDAGRSKLGFVWWSAGTAAHSISAYLDREKDQPRTLMVDGLNPPEQPELWPDAYFHGHAWPAVFKEYPQPYSAELYVRGIDSYVWAEGYIIRGANAGSLFKAAIPYLQTREKKSVSQVYGGPFPQ